MNVSLHCPTCDHIQKVPIGSVVVIETPEDATQRWFPCPDCGWQHAVVRDQIVRLIRNDERTDDIEDRRVQFLVHCGAIWLDFSDLAVDLTGEEA